MSICICKDCDAYIDSDDDPDCFVEIGNERHLYQTIILCERCREERENEQDQKDAAASLAEYQAEQLEAKP